MLDHTTECNDGTICENSSACTPHPIKEAKYVCDCSKAVPQKGNNDATAQFAGVYCEMQSTEYCRKGGSSSSSVLDHAFCTNGGECRLMMGKNEEHAGCKCPPGYEGHFCQFITGSKPSDWELTDYMHPALAYTYADQQNGDGWWLGIVVGTSVFFVVVGCLFVMSLYCGFVDIREKLRRSEKEKDTAAENGNGSNGVALGGRRQSQASPRNTSFLGGKSVYKKKNTAPSVFVTSDTLEADGGALQDAMMEDQAPSMEEVDLDAEPTGELA